MTSIVLVFDKSSGGLGDRVVGMTSTILLAQCLGRPWYIEWKHPNVTGVLSITNPSHIRHKKKNSVYLSIMSPEERGKKKSILKSRNLKSLWKARHIVLRCNQEIGRYLSENPNFFIPDYETALKASYNSVFTEILVPTNTINPPLPTYVAIQLRTGDVVMKAGRKSFVSDIKKPICSLANFIKEKGFEAVYVTSDNPSVAKCLEKALPEVKVFRTKGSNIHFTQSKTTPVQLKTLLDDFLLLREADTIVISHWSNYGRVACLSGKSKLRYSIRQPDYRIAPVAFEDLMSKHDK